MRRRCSMGLCLVTLVAAACASSPGDLDAGEGYGLPGSVAALLLGRVHRRRGGRATLRAAA